MLRLLLLVALGQVARGATQPSPCCTDRQFTAIVGRIGASAYPLTGNTVFIDDYQEMAFDYYRKRIGGLMHQRQPDGSMRNISYLMDYNTDRQNIYADAKCTIMKIGKTMTSPCIPSNATFLSSETLGFGTDSLKINTFEFMMDGMLVKWSVTDKACVPVLSASYGRVAKVATEIVELYSFFKPGIDDPSNMEPSQYDNQCTFVDIPDSTPDSSGSLVGRRSVF